MLIVTEILIKKEIECAGQSKNILIIDDHPVFREALKVFIDGSQRYNVVDEAGLGRQDLKKANKIKPDLVIVDFSMPDMTGTQIIYEIRKSLPETKIMIIGMDLKIYDVCLFTKK